MNKVTRLERGWAGHFIGADRCLFRRNTLLTTNDVKLVVSTVGAMVLDGKLHEVGLSRYYETMVFHASWQHNKYWDADVTKTVGFDSDWSIQSKDADNEANAMHEAVVAEMTQRLEAGDLCPAYCD